MKHLTALVIAVLAPLAAAAQDAENGAELFTQHCATCHGVEAQGDGPMNSVLIIRPTDLTQLAAQNDGTFPVARVIARIDGRDPLVSHGSPMPIYGQFFEGKGETIRGEDGVMIMTSQPVIDLVAYLEGVQG
ncbi:c-type cytochrome [Litoreibacter arenae]|uniref:Cytochrome c family protein, putative n=1 Tax=Litoreibacter arenae DSM 19593 TaxID=1123360 RepID=S9QNP4_9RHOB|nr:cytochrome c [Litoreibacter arenae]EPX81332.1 cytochrome c family protein, putative [Litoreibacter arenae DSM 19593]